MINSACSRRKLEPKCICMLCVVSLFVFVVIALFLPPRGPQERLILYGTQLDRQLQEQGNSRDENALNRVDIRTAINKKKAFGFIDGAKHASDSKSDQAPQLISGSHQRRMPALNQRAKRPFLFTFPKISRSPK